MAKHRSIIIPFRWVEAGRVRKCYHNPNHKIVKGDRVLEVKVKLAWLGYCHSCGQEMLREAIARLHSSK